MYTVEIWVDANPDDFVRNRAICLVSAAMQAHPTHKGLFCLPSPIAQTLPSGLHLEVSCERTADGSFHVGFTHNGELVSSGKYSGSFTVRVFPPGYPSYVLDVRVAEQD